MGRQAFRLDDPSKDVFEALLERLFYVFYKYKNISVSWSGGKDSTVLAEMCSHVAHKLQKPWHLIFFDDEMVDPDTEAFAHRTKERMDADPYCNFHWVCGRVKHTLRGKGRSHWVAWDPEEKERWFRKPPPFAYTHDEFGPHPKTRDGLLYYGQLLSSFLHNVLGIQDNLASMLGVRVSESYNRSRMFTISGGYIFPYSEWGKGENVAVIKPLYDWRTYDVWLAIKQNKWDYSRFYDKMYTAGIIMDKQRVAPLGTTASAPHLYLLQAFYPEAWDKLIRRLPEVRPLGQLGAIGRLNSGQSRPVGYTWFEWTFELVKTLDKDSQEFWYDYLSTSMKRFKAEFGFPIPETPIGDGNRMLCQGYCWYQIARAVIKNDRLMGRPRDLSY